MRKHFGNPLEMVRKTRFEMSGGGGGNILLVHVHFPHTGKCATALQVIISFLFFFFSFSEMLFYYMVRYLFIDSCGKIKRYNACELLQSLLSKISDICECERQWVIVYMRD